MTTACHSENKLSRDECLLGVFHKSLIFKDFMVRLPWVRRGSIRGEEALVGTKEGREQGFKFR